MATATLNNPTEDGYLTKDAGIQSDYPAARTACLIASPSRSNSGDDVSYGGYGEDEGGEWLSFAYRGYVEWDISAYAGATIDSNPVFKYNGHSQGGTSGEINPLTDEDPAGASDANLWGYIASGTAYVDPFTLSEGTGKSQDLGATAKSDLQTAVTAEQSWFAIGFQSPDDECPDSAGFPQDRFYAEEKSGVNPAPTLEFDYTLVTDYPISAAVSLGTALTVSRLADYPRSVPLSMGLAAAASRVITITRTASAPLGFIASATRGFITSALTTMGFAATASRAIAISRTSSISLGLVSAVQLAYGVFSNAVLGLATTAQLAYGFFSNVTLGLATTASRALTIARSSAVTLGLVTTASRLANFPRTALIALGTALTASRVIVVSRTSSATLGLAVKIQKAIRLSASVVMGFYTVATTLEKIKRLVRRIGTNRDISGVGTNRDISSDSENRDVEDF